MGRKGKSAARKSKVKKTDDDAESMLPDDFTIVGSEDGDTVFGGWDDNEGSMWAMGNENGIEEEEYIDDEAVLTMLETSLGKFKDVLSSVDDFIGSEKSAKKREAGYRQLFKTLTHYGLGDDASEFLNHYLSSVTTVATTSLRNTASEQYATCRCLEAAAVILGGGNDEFFEAVEPPLKRCLMGTGNQPQVRSAAIRALALTTFICSTDMSATHELLNTCEQVCAEEWRGEAVHPHLRAAALDAWGLLATTIDDKDVSSEDGRGTTILPLLQKALDSPSAELRASAGENVALIHSARLNLGVTDEDATTTAKRFRRGSWDGTEFEVLVDEVKQRMAELAQESGHHMSKKDKKRQRSTFREYMATLVDDEAPCETVIFRGGTLELSTWKEIKQLGAIRACCQGAFMLQMSYNSTLHEIFGADMKILNNGDGLSSHEKRMFMSKNSAASKTRDREMQKDRKKRSNQKNMFLDADGEDL